MECESTIRVSKESSKEEDDLLRRSNMKVKRKADEGENPLEMEEALEMFSRGQSVGEENRFSTP